MTQPLKWRRSENGAVQVADSAVTTDDGQRGLQWFLGGGGNYWGLSLAPPGRARVWHQQVTGTEDDVKDVAARFETEHAGAATHFALVEVLVRYFLVGGAAVTRVAHTVTDALHIGELNSGFAGPAEKELRKARRDNKVLRVIVEAGVAIIPASQITHVVVLQRDKDTGTEFLGEPGWPQHMLDADRGEVASLVDQLMDLASEYAEKRVLADRTGPGNEAALKAVDAAKAHLRTHVEELVEVDE